jgi:hypothetical protein
MNVARQKQAVAGRAHGTVAGKNGVSRGTAMMKSVAEKTLEKHGEKITGTLYQGMVGSATRAKLLFALAGGQLDCEDEVVLECICSLAEKLASEQAWTGPGDERSGDRGRRT